VTRDYAHALGARLREVRARQGLTLHDIEAQSGGRWKAVVVGSYERAARAMTVVRLAELADFYGIPVRELLPKTPTDRPAAIGPNLVIDLQLLSALPPEQVGPLARYAAAIRSQRADYHGRVLTLREEDLRSLAVLYNLPQDILTDRLTGLGVLATGP
jgi:transcriptional regulator with XRE-family HTH domain